MENHVLEFLNNLDSGRIKVGRKLPYFILQIGLGPASCIANIDGYYPTAYSLGP